MSTYNQNYFYVQPDTIRPQQDFKPQESSTLTKVVSTVSYIAGAVFTGFFIAGTALSLTAKIFTGSAVIGSCGAGATAIAKIIAHILTGKAQTKDWVFLAFAVAGAVIGFFVGGGIPGAILGALALPGMILTLIGLISWIDLKINAPSLRDIALENFDQFENLELLEQAQKIRDIQLQYSSFPLWIPRLVDYF